MTQILTAASPDWVVQISDRLVVAKRGADTAEHDPVSNKVVVYRATDALVTIGYTGIAYIGRTTTDQWIAEVFCQEKLAAPGERFGIRTGGKRQTINIGLAVNQLQDAFESLPSNPVDRHALELVIAGWQVNARGLVRPILWELSRRNGKTTLWKAPRHWQSDSNFRISEIGVPPREGAIQERLAPFREGQRGPLVAEAVEEIFVDVMRETTGSNVTVGSHALSVVLSRPGTGICGCRFHPFVPHQASIQSRDRTMIVDVAHTPWVIGPGLIYRPSMEIGHSILDLSGMEFHIFGAERQGSLTSLSSSLSRLPPP